MKKIAWLLGMVVLLVGPRVGLAEAKCPWLNAATAGGLLGGDVTMTVSEPMAPVSGKGVGTAMYPDQVRMDRFDVTCEFRRASDSGADVLRIVVKTMADQAKDYAGYVAQCGGTATALRGIGNEAVQCAGKEQVVARVRDRVFVLTVDRGPVPGDALPDDTRNIAEQVAGSLF